MSDEFITEIRKESVVCPRCNGTGDMGGNPSYGPCNLCGGSGRVAAVFYANQHSAPSSTTNDREEQMNMANDIDWMKVSRALKDKASKMQDHANAVSVGSKDENRANALGAGAAVLRAIAEALDFGVLHEEDR